MTAPVRDSPGLSADAFLARVRRGLGRVAPSAPPTPPEIPIELARLVGPREDIAAAFRRRAAAVGMNVVDAALVSLRDVLLTLLPRQPGATIAMEVRDARLVAPTRAALLARGAAILEPRPARGFEPLFDAAAGISDVDAGLADSGTLVLSSGALRGRGVSIVPPVHVALLPLSRIVPDLLDWAAATPSNPPATASHTVLITGPSKTADIEGVLITGVHGPGRVHVVVISDA
jgi:L-lactate dehydrogenase complex protein LldG